MALASGLLICSDVGWNAPCIEGEFNRSAQQCLQTIGGGIISEDFPRPAVEFENDRVEVILSEVGHAGALLEELTVRHGAPQGRRRRQGTHDRLA